MRRIMAVVCLLGVLVAGASGVEAKKKAKGKKVAKARTSRCIDARQSADATEITWSFANGCETEVVCVARWTLSCGDKPTENGAKEESAALSPGERSEITASAASCGETWELASPRWSCSTSVRAQK